MKTPSIERTKYPQWTLAGLGSLLTFINLASATVRYVDVNSANPAPPYTNWATAARVIQDAVDAASASDEIVVTNGVYATGAREVHGTNRVAVTKPLTVRSVNGPAVTVIRGYQVPGITIGAGAIRCVYLTNGATLAGFTLTNGATHNSYRDNWNQGGGVFCASTSSAVSNCCLLGNSALGGGGALGGTLMDCRLEANEASEWGEERQIAS